MTKVFEKRADGPQTHAFIIGVGAYQHLPGGTGPVLADAQGLGQLTSPPQSARAFADWLFTEFNNPQAPLGSVEMLLSPRGNYDVPHGETVEVEPATFSNVSASFQRWFVRCDEDKRNIALFYFCGHGVMKEGEVLLVEDFGENPFNPFDHAIDLRKLHMGMASCRPDVQCYFVDACRQIPWAVREHSELDARVLVSPKPADQRSRDAPIFYASAPNDRAYGQAGGATRFTAALLDGLRGQGSCLENGQWVVTTTRLGEAISKTVERANLSLGTPPQRCALGGEVRGKPIQFLAGPPVVPVTVQVSPPEASPNADLELRSFADPKVLLHRIPLPGDWQFNAAADKYELSAAFPAGGFRGQRCQLWVLPPFTDWRLEVTA